MNDTTPSIPVSKVFISYSWTSDDYANDIMDIATRLHRNPFIDVVLDRWDLKPGQDKFAFMEQMATDSSIQKVLVMCDKRYAQRANERKGGVGTESTIISQEVYNQMGQEKFIPIVMERDADGEPFLPVFLKSRIYIDLSDPRRFEAGYEDLVRNISGQPLHVKPLPSQPPSFMIEGSRATSPTTYAKRAFEDAMLRDKRHATGLGKDYLNALLEALRGLRFDAKQLPEKDAIAGVMMERLAQWTPLRDEFVEYLRFTAQYGSDARLYEELARFFDNSLTITTGRYSDQVNEHINFIVHETFLYAITVLIQEEQFDAASILLGTYYRDPDEEMHLQRFGIFVHLKTQYLEQVAQSTWDARYTSPLWKLSQERATNENVTFAALRETDFVLHVRFLLEEKGERFSVPNLLSWHPITFSWDYIDNYSTQFFLFTRAMSRRYFHRFKPVLGVENKEDLMTRWSEAFPPNEGRIFNSDRTSLIKSIVQPDKLDTTA